MQDILTCAMGLDVHRDIIVACLVKGAVDAEQPQFETTFILEKDGERREFTLDNYPDSTWTFIDSRTVQTSEGYIPPIHDFTMTRIADDEDITEEVINSPGYTMLLVAPYLEKSDDMQFSDINRLYDYARENQVPFYCLTASNTANIEKWKDMTGAEYPFCSTDATFTDCGSAVWAGVSAATSVGFIDGVST